MVFRSFFVVRANGKVNFQATVLHIRIRGVPDRESPGRDSFPINMNRKNES